MPHFRDTEEARAFIATADSRETSPEIMEAIAFFARNIEEAEALWEGDGFGRVCHVTDLWERVTRNGFWDAEDFCWGASGSKWWPMDGFESVPERTFRFIGANGTDITGTDGVAGYNVRDYFDCDIRTATDAELAAAYRGADCDGIGVEW